MKTIKDQLLQSGFKLNNNLKTSYEEAKKNIIFLELIKKIKLDEKYLMKYTSSLEDSAIEFNNCKNCKGLVECTNKVNGYCYLPLVLNNLLEFNYKACKFQKKLLEIDKSRNLVKMFYLPTSLKDAQMKDVYVDDKKRFEVIKWITEFINNYPNVKKGLYLHGSFGCGKSYLIAALFNELAKNKINSAIIFWPSYLEELKSSFNQNNYEQNSFKEKMEYIKRVPLLLIDDVGAENMTPWSRDDVFCPLVQYRMDEHLPTFFTSNLDFEALESHFANSKNSVEEVKAKRVIERIKQLTEQIELISKNLRH